MVALVTRGLLVVQLIVATMIAAALVKTGRTANVPVSLLFSIGIVALLRMLITANSFFLSWRFGSKTPAEYRLTWQAACRLFLNEYAASMLSSSFTMPFRSFAKRQASTPMTLPVLLVHGYFCNSGYWHSMSKALLRAGITHHAVDLEPLTAGIDTYVPALQNAITTLCRDTGSDKVIIIAHSMGGLAARAYLRAHGAENIARVITLGTPHAGTKEAQFGMGENCIQMHQDSKPNPWLQELATTENPQTRALFTSIYSHHDNIIAPQTSSHLPGATNIELSGIGHVALGLDSHVQSHVVNNILAASHMPTSQATTTSLS
jgi:triacylglycerol esterase/lipase EstA (alpha/beta hydrolase family)